MLLACIRKLYFIQSLRHITAHSLEPSKNYILSTSFLWRLNNLIPFEIQWMCWVYFNWFICIYFINECKFSYCWIIPTCLGWIIDNKRKQYNLYQKKVLINFYYAFAFMLDKLGFPHRNIISTSFIIKVNANILDFHQTPFWSPLESLKYVRILIS